MATTFKDNQGRAWTLAVNVASIKRVKADLGMYLPDVLKGELVQQLASDPILLVDTIYSLCRPDAQAANVTAEQFGEAMAGDAIEHATKALLDECVNFSQNPRDRAALGRIVSALWKTMDKARDLVETRLDGIQIEKVMEEAILKAWNDPSNASSGNVPASSE